MAILPLEVQVEHPKYRLHDMPL